MMKKKLVTAIVLIVFASLTYIYLTWQPEPEKPILTTVSYDSLPNWGNRSLVKSFNVFKKSCEVFVRQDPNRSLETDVLKLTVKDMLPACHEALSNKSITPKRASQFFQTWFQPIEVRHPNDSPIGLFTGYYAPLIHGSLEKTDKYNVPIYTRPASLIRIKLSKFDPDLENKTLVGRIQRNEFVPYYDREAINNGALKNVPVLAWVDNRIERIFLEIQGSGIIQLEDGKRMFVGYADQNGQPYTSLAGVLIQEGLMTRNNASMQAIKQYFQQHPETMDKFLHQNQSFVFFENLKQKGAVGAQGIEITPGYSLAVDRRYVPLGLPIWLSTTYPDKVSDDHQPLDRLMIAQDTGGAIKGPIRGDVYWGDGEKATFTAGHMKNPGRWWLLVPKNSLIDTQKNR